MEIDSAVYLAQETAHALEEAVELYDRVEAYEICGQGLREAYVGLKRLRHQVWAPSCVLRQDHQVTQLALPTGSCA